jgi:lipopolysaccharide/colanic/teichoic acid biosynthesis glycosyltransferase
MGVKRLLDVLASGLGLLVLSPLLAVLSIAIWRQDYHSPFYVAERTGRGGRSYRMVKFRSMVVRADRAGVDSTAANDSRITPLGHVIRRFKLDELPQLWNVLRGEMSLVGPRPNVKREVDIYTAVERDLLRVRPGITDMASIVFSDEGDILKGSDDPDLKYNQVIRPWKSQLGLLYVERSGPVLLDLKLIGLTVLSAVDRPRALAEVSRLVGRLGGSDELSEVVLRREELRPAPPPGASEIVVRRDGPPV